ncbi:MaoC family dehydratase [Priestia megaterium]|uniref:MaoC like domain protein n=1 Tax=Priestia megaterium (strain ATCC 14581 / DSM 32 / CCUG 1817 / JCM 2506 / NBRC 15308 / NCIMB 9376 / NCTC 10342 / NRRL B-14308 / VKM B-512 / Ford 19) TaxID=1348623 RepID=A0A0B6A6R3_PRIM2|nr:MaoC family dehydratase [Priestia megaterium]MCJ7990060.1 MaoC family dehydratase [Priestia sp. OVS21]AJI20635.1 maoC like domain protein [Priestia megaterium NBRC 15308 = ATCC 14581]KFN06034.1 maoC like domain protein [Priestia megaterium]KGJ81204.1 dehydratase [Priestia megaterium NBRC 15308 = ATCC 14581]MDR4232750.1 MaoC family dehydratase [Priestia megaterium]
MSKKVPFEVGDTVSYTKTISESDVYLFAGITGDFSQMHMNEEFMKTTPYKTRIVHGVLTFALGSTASTLIQTQARSEMPSVSYGYDRLRFTRPVYFGDTVTAVYTITEVDQESLKSYAKVEIYNQNKELCVVAQHTLKFFEN